MPTRAAEGRGYSTDAFVCGDSKLALEGLADRLEAARYQADPALLEDLRAAHEQAVATLRDGLGPYAELVRQVQAKAGRNFNWVRDVTVSNSTWGNRELRIFEPSAGVHATGGGIGQGMPMAIGAAVGAAVTGSGRKTFCLAGDGGFILNLGELATVVQEKADLVIVLMNDKGYGVIKNIQDAQYGGRRCYVDLHTPDYALLCKSLALPHACVKSLAELEARLDRGAGQGRPLPAGDRHAVHRRLQERLRRPADQHRDADPGARRRGQVRAQHACKLRSSAAVPSAPRCWNCCRAMPACRWSPSSCRQRACKPRAAAVAACWRRAPRWSAACRLAGIDLVVEAAGHAAIEAHVLPALRARHALRGGLGRRAVGQRAGEKP